MVLLRGASALTLPESINYGLKNNPSVQAAKKQVDAAAARLAQATGAFLPTIKLDGSLSKTYSEPSIVQISTQEIVFGTSDVGSISNYKLSLSQPLFVGALFPGYKIAQKGVETSREEYRRVALETSYGVTVAYYGVLAAARYVKLSEESLEMAKTHLQQVAGMLDAGVVTRADYLRTEVRVANAEVDLTNARNIFQLAKGQFNNVLGRDVDSPVELAEEKVVTTFILPKNNQLFSEALIFSPSWKSFILNKQVAEENLSLARTAYLPTAYLTGSMGNQLSVYPSFATSANSWTVTGAASWTIFDGLTITNRVREAAANLEAQNATEDQVKNNLALEVRDAYLNLQKAVESLQSNKKAVNFAEESHKITTQRYNAGVGTNLEVIDAQVAMTQAKINLLKATYDVATGKAKINKIVGKEVI